MKPAYDLPIKSGLHLGERDRRLVEQMLGAGLEKLARLATIVGSQASRIPTEPRGRGSNRDLSNCGRLADIRATS